MKSASPGPREAPAPLQEDMQAGLLRGKHPNKQGVQRPGWAGRGGLGPMGQQEDVGLGLGLQDMAPEKGPSPKAHH